MLQRSIKDLAPLAGDAYTLSHGALSLYTKNGCGAEEPLRSLWTSYYYSLDSITSYPRVLRTTRQVRLSSIASSHAKYHGWYNKDTIWPFCLSAALRRMENKFVDALKLPADSLVLQAVCGDGHVPIRMVEKSSFRAEGMDITPCHIDNAGRQVSKARLKYPISTRNISFQNEVGIVDNKYHGGYPSEANFHAMAVEQADDECCRVHPGRNLALHEGDLGESYEATSKEQKYRPRCGRHANFKRPNNWGGAEDAREHRFRGRRGEGHHTPYGVNVGIFPLSGKHPLSTGSGSGHHHQEVFKHCVDREGIRIRRDFWKAA